jgi:hypothetical protein
MECAGGAPVQVGIQRNLAVFALVSVLQTEKAGNTTFGSGARSVKALSERNDLAAREDRA